MADQKKEKKRLIERIPAKIRRVIVLLIEIFGTFFSLYVSIYVMIVQPAMALYSEYRSHTLKASHLFIDILSFIFALTAGGGLWCLFDIIAGIFRDRD
jgi:TRAP-type C4-dicarboxylate transport system permease small subunit